MVQMDSQKDVVNIRPSIVGGLNKVDVTGYIQKLQDQILELDEQSDLQRQKIEDLKKRLNDAEVFYRALWNNCESQKETIQYQKELIDQLKSCSEESVPNLKNRQELLGEKEEDLKSRQELVKKQEEDLQDRIGQLKKKAEKKSKPDKKADKKKDKKKKHKKK